MFFKKIYNILKKSYTIDIFLDLYKPYICNPIIQLRNFKTIFLKKISRPKKHAIKK